LVSAHKSAIMHSAIGTGETQVVLNRLIRAAAIHVAATTAPKPRQQGLMPWPNGGAIASR
jgi:hypothetical protein